MPSGASHRSLWSRRLTSVLVLCGSLLPLSASAGILTIEFDFAAGSSLSILGGVINTPPDGTISGGSATLTVDASSATNVTTGGGAVLSGANLTGFAAKNVQGQADVSGGFSISQTGSAAGTLGAADSITFSDPFTADVLSNFFCFGAQCSALGFPASFNGPVSLPLQPLPVQNLSTVGGALIDFDVPVSLDGVQAVFRLVGTETSRSFIPEPGTASLLGLGLLTIALGRRGPMRARC